MKKDKIDKKKTPPKAPKATAKAEATKQAAEDAARERAITEDKLANAKDLLKVEEIEEKRRAIAKKKSAEDIKQFKEGIRTGYADGFKNGVDSMESGIAEIRKAAFEDGIRHLATLAMDCLASELGVPSRGEVVQSNETPVWWNLALLTHFFDTQKKVEKVAPLVEAEVAEVDYESES